MVSSSDLATHPIAVVTFEGCYWHRFGGPNDDVFEGHPLANRDFDKQGAFLVHNSRWLDEARATNGVHRQYTP